MKQYPKIETWTLNKSDPVLVTTQFETTFEARKARAKELGYEVTSVMGRKL